MSSGVVGLLIVFFIFWALFFVCAGALGYSKRQSALLALLGTASCVMFFSTKATPGDRELELVFAFLFMVTVSMAIIFRIARRKRHDPIQLIGDKAMEEMRIEAEVNRRLQNFDPTKGRQK